MACECGCGWEGEDDVTQWCIEEAVFEQLAVVEARALSGTAEVEPSSQSPLDADWMDRARRFAAGEDS